MKLVRFSQVPHPDLKLSVSAGVFVDAERVVSIETGSVSYAIEESLEKHRRAYHEIHVAVGRVFEQAEVLELDALLKEPEKFGAFQRVVSEYGKAVQDAPKVAPDHHPRVECTVIRYGYEPQGGWGMCFVTESPDEVAEKLRLALLH